MNIGKSHDVIKYIKKIKIKSNEDIYIEDLSVLSFLKEEKKKLEIFIYCEELIFSKEANEIVSYFKVNSTNVYTVSKRVYEEIITKGFSAGVIGVYKYHYSTFNDLKDKSYLLVLDGLETPGNLGTIIRTCDSFNVEGIILVDSKTNVFNPKVVQSSRGMSLFIPIVNTTYEEAQQFLLDNKFDIYLGEPELGKSYLDYEYNNKTCLVFGNERFGINPNWYQNQHLKLYIPMFGKMTSLNVSVAASIVIAYTGIIRKKLF